MRKLAMWSFGGAAAVGIFATGYYAGNSRGLKAGFDRGVEHRMSLEDKPTFSPMKAYWVVTYDENCEKSFAVWDRGRYYRPRISPETGVLTYEPLPVLEVKTTPCLARK